VTDHEPPPGQLQAMHDIAIPPGMRERVRGRVEARLDHLAVHPHGRARRAAPWLAAAAVGAAAVVAVVAAGSGPPPSRAPSGAGSGPPPSGGAVVAGAGPSSSGGPDVAAPRPISAAADERIELPLPHGHVSVRGPAEARVAGSRVELTHGTLDVLGQATISGPTCDAQIDGTAEVSVKRSTLIVRRIAGSVEVRPRSVTCDVIELSPPPPPIVPSSIAPSPAAAVVAPSASAPSSARPARTPSPLRLPAATVVEPPVSPPRAPPALAPPPDPLADAVAAYHAAAAREPRDPTAAVAAWDAWLVRFPDNALAHSVEVRTLALLVRLDRRAEAAARARAFLARYPDSPRRADVERIAGAAP
jgi:hypothetical protein